MTLLVGNSQAKMSNFWRLLGIHRKERDYYTNIPPVRESILGSNFIVGIEMKHSDQDNIPQALEERLRTQGFEKLKATLPIGGLMTDGCGPKKSPKPVQVWNTSAESNAKEGITNQHEKPK